jgi:NADH:ubiquinone oxidoreductase subunit E
VWTFVSVEEERKERVRVDMTFELSRHGCGGACGGRWGRARRMVLTFFLAYRRQPSSKKEATICPRGGPDMVWANDGDDESV